MAGGSGGAKADRPREFNPVEDPIEARKLIKEGSRNLAPAMIWAKEQKYVINTALSVYDEPERILYASIPPDIGADAFIAQLDGLGSRDCFFSVSLARANIFFRARLLGFDAGGFKFQAPETIFKVQRRRDMRLFIPFGRVVRIELTDPTFPEQKLSKKIFDISARGLSFIVTDAEAPLFPAGALLKSMFFSIGSRKIVCDGEVRHTRAQPANSAQPGHKVGVSFTRIGAGDQGWIAAYVFEESRKIIAKFM
jgi:hypothetical protein